MFLLDGAVLSDTDQLDLQGLCQVWNVEENDDLWTSSYVCDEGPLSLSLQLPVSPGLQAGDVVELSLFVDSPAWGNGFVKIIRDGELEVAAMTSQALPIGGGSFPPSDFFAPLSVSVVADLCEPEPLVEPEVGRSFIAEEPCTQDRRLGLAFDLGDDSTTLLDRTGGELGPLEIYVGRTVSHMDIFCPETPDGWREFVAVRG